MPLCHSITYSLGKFKDSFNFFSVSLGNGMTQNSDIIGSNSVILLENLFGVFSVFLTVDYFPKIILLVDLLIHLLVY